MWPFLGLVVGGGYSLLCVSFCPFRPFLGFGGGRFGIFYCLLLGCCFGFLLWCQRFLWFCQMPWWHMLTHLCISGHLPGILSTFLACHDDQVCADVYDNEDADVGVDGVAAHATFVVRMAVE